VRVRGSAAVAAAALALLAGCTSAATQRTAPTDPVLLPSGSADTGGAVRTQSPVAEIDVCTAIPAATLEDVLGVSFDPGVAGTPGGSLLGECDYVPASTSASPSMSASPATPTSTTPATSTPVSEITHVYVAARSGSQYAAMVKAYQLTAMTVAGQQGAFGPTAGLLVHVPFGDYVLQVAVSDADGVMLQAPAEAIAARYISS
jgi:hypothetical protein